MAVDFNDRVEAGQVLATLDRVQLEARLRQSEAALVLARARVRESDATVIETNNRLRRTSGLISKGLSSDEELDSAVAASARAEAGLAVAKAQVDQAQAELDANQRTLEKASIRSPIDGIVLEREVEPGQTVAASLQTPVHRFPARITQVRFAPETVEGVVTYETLLSVDNAELLLRPGMTATAEIEVRRVEDALLVPNAALRFVPPRQSDKDAGSSRSGGGLPGMLLPRRPRHSLNHRQESVEAEKGQKRSGCSRTVSRRPSRSAPAPRTWPSPRSWPATWRPAPRSWWMRSLGANLSLGARGSLGGPGAGRCRAPVA